MQASIKLSQVGRDAYFPLNLSKYSYHNTATLYNQNVSNSIDEACACEDPRGMINNVTTPEHPQVVRRQN